MTISRPPLKVALVYFHWCRSHQHRFWTCVPPRSRARRVEDSAAYQRSQNV